MTKLKSMLIGIVLIVLVVGGLLLNSYLQPPPKDLNVYLNEEACFTGEIYIKVDGLSVTEIEENQTDNDGEQLSGYMLNLEVVVEQRNDSGNLKNFTLKPEMFQLKSVNLKAKSKMGVFFESLFKATVKASIGGTIEGSINIIEQVIDFAGDYVEGSIENAKNKNDFKPMRLNDDAFEPFKTNEKTEPTKIAISFPIKKQYLESENVIVLAIDTAWKWEKRIFLITRPQ